ncbi:MAG TPA: response regulator [Herpetosiphonaceae bacterium]
MPAPTIVIIDDDRDTLRLFTLMFEMAGYQVIAAQSAAEGLACLPDARAAAVLCDLRMPGMDGLDFCAAVRADPRLRQLPIVLTSGASMGEPSLPANTIFVTKPVAQPALTALVDAHIRVTRHTLARM